MATMKSTAANGRQRKTLADQLDRQDHILDGLGEALAEAVAQSVKEGVAAALTQLAGRPGLHRATDIRPTTADMASLWNRERRSCGRATAWLVKAAEQTTRFLHRVWGQEMSMPQRQQMAGGLYAAWRVLTKAAVRAWGGMPSAISATRRRNLRLCVAAGMGIVGGGACCLAGRPVVAATLGVLAASLMIVATETRHRGALPYPAESAPAAIEPPAMAGVV
jgi:hypothetical protein